jgi:hypothetical protein
MGGFRVMFIIVLVLLLVPVLLAGFCLSVFSFLQIGHRERGMGENLVAAAAGAKGAALAEKDGNEVAEHTSRENA